MRKFHKQLIAVLTTFLLILAIMPTAVVAEDGEDNGDTSGTTTDESGSTTKDGDNPPPPPPPTAEVNPSTVVDLGKSVVMLYWGDVDKNFDPGTVTDPVTCDGSVESLSAHVVKLLRWDSADRLNTKHGASVEFQSSIYGGVDGLVFHLRGDEFTFSSECLGDTTITLDELKSGPVSGSLNDYGFVAKLLRDKGGQGGDVIDLRPHRLALMWGGTDETTDFSGSLEASDGQVEVIKELIFERNDEVTEAGPASSITWTSSIAGHKDGLFVGVIPEAETVLTLEVGEDSFEIANREDLKEYELSNGGWIRIKHAGRHVKGGNEKIGRANGAVPAVKAKIENKFEQIPQHCEEILEEISTFDFGEEKNDATDVADLLDEAYESNNGTDLLGRCRIAHKKFIEIRQGVMDASFRKGHAKFKDFDPGQWFAGYVDTVADTSVGGQKILEGFKNQDGSLTGEFGAGHNVRMSELLKMVLTMSNHGQGSGQGLEGLNDHWAKGFFHKAKELDLSVSGDDFTAPNEYATRGEVFQTLVESLGIDSNCDVSSLDFSDLNVSHKHAVAACVLFSEGIISGTDDGKLKLDSSVTRAEMAKIIHLALQEFVNSQQDADELLDDDELEDLDDGDDLDVL